MKRDERLTGHSLHRQHRHGRLPGLGTLAVAIMFLGGCGGGDGSSPSGTAVSMQQTAANQQLTAQQAAAQSQAGNQTYIDPVAYSGNATDGLAPAQASEKAAVTTSGR